MLPRRAQWRERESVGNEETVVIISMFPEKKMEDEMIDIFIVLGCLTVGVFGGIVLILKVRKP